MPPLVYYTCLTPYPNRTGRIMDENWGGGINVKQQVDGCTWNPQMKINRGQNLRTTLKNGCKISFRLFVGLVWTHEIYSLRNIRESVISLHSTEEFSMQFSTGNKTHVVTESVSLCSLHFLISKKTSRQKNPSPNDRKWVLHRCRRLVLVTQLE